MRELQTLLNDDMASCLDMGRRHPGEARAIAQAHRGEEDFRSSFSPIQEVGCTACFRVSDTRCGACVILPAFLQSKRSIKQPGGRLPGEQGRYRAADGPGNGWAQRSNR